MELYNSKLDYTKGNPTGYWVFGKRVTSRIEDPDTIKMIIPKEATKGSHKMLRMNEDPSSGSPVVREEHGLATVKILNMGPLVNGIFPWGHKLQVGDEVFIVPNPSGGLMAMENVNDPNPVGRFNAQDIYAIRDARTGIIKPFGHWIFLRPLILRYFKMGRAVKSRKDKGGWVDVPYWHRRKDGTTLTAELKRRELHDPMGEVIDKGCGVTRKHPLLRVLRNMNTGPLPVKPGDLVLHRMLINEHGMYTQGAFECVLNGEEGYMMPFTEAYGIQSAYDLEIYRREYQREVLSHKARLSNIDDKKKKAK